MSGKRRVGDGGQKIVDGINEVLAWTKGDASAARLVPFQAPTSIDVKSIRAKLGLTQKEFAARFGLKIESLRNWEQDKRVPDTSTRVLLTIIEKEPEAVKKALAIA